MYRDGDGNEYRNRGEFEDRVRKVVIRYPDGTELKTTLLYGKRMEREGKAKITNKYVTF